MARLLLTVLAVTSYSLLVSSVQAAPQEAWPSITDLLQGSPLAPFIPQVRRSGCESAA